MKIVHIVAAMGFGTLLCFPPVTWASERTVPPAKPVALVYSLVGGAVLTEPSKAPQSLRLFDRLVAGTTVEVASGARLALAFANGRRYELGGISKATIGRADLSSRSGPVRPLPTFPPLPHLSPIAEEENPGLSAGAVRIRSERITGLYPRHGAATLAGETTLRFDPVEGGGKYRVEVQDRQGRIVFSTETTDPTVNTGKTLKTGMRYDWTVRTIERVGSVATGQATFLTLPSVEAKGRGALREAVESAGDGPSLALLAEIDRSLGLWGEALDELRTAVRKSPGDANLAKVLAEVERRSGEEIPEGETGVVIEEVLPRSLGALAGLLPGDLLFSWCRSVDADGPCQAVGTLASPFDIADLETEQAPRGGVKLAGRRGAENMTWSLLPGPLKIETRPVLPSILSQIFQQGSDLAKGGDLNGAAERWRTAAKSANRKSKRHSLWFLWRLADAYARGQQTSLADSLYAEAATEARQSDDKAAEARLLFIRARALQLRGALAEAAEDYDRALAIYREISSDSLAVAAVLHDVCVMTDGLTLCRQALEIRERLAPRSFAVSNTLVVFGNKASGRGDYEEAEQYLRRALALDTEIAPDSVECFWSLLNASAIAVQRGDLEAAEDLLNRARRIVEVAEPDGSKLAMVLNNLGVMNGRRGDVEAAEDLLLRSLAIKEKLAPDGIAVAQQLSSLGDLAAKGGNLDAAEAYARRSLELCEKLGANLDAARNLLILGQIHIDRGNLERSRTFFRRALDGGLNVIEHAEGLRGLGRVALGLGDLAAAESHFRRALEILDQQAPDSEDRALVLKDLGRLERLRDRLGPAAELYCRAVDALESVWSRLGRGDRSAFGTSAASYFASCIGAQLRLGKSADAFRLLENGRARIFLERLANRDLAAGDLPADLVAQRQKLDRAYDAAQTVLASLDPGREATRLAEMRSRLLDIRSQKEGLRERIERASPRYASLHLPKTLDLDGVRRTLDQGTALLAYVIDESQTYLFVVLPAEQRGSKGLLTFALPVSEKVLGLAVTTFRNLLQNGDSDPTARNAQASKLYDLLVRPAERQIVGAKRLLVLPDGILHTLPFATLVRKQNGKRQYLVEWRPIHSVLSATVYSELLKKRRPVSDAAQLQLVAFGDPQYPSLSGVPDSASGVAPEVLAAARRGLSLEPLPASRREVEELAAVYPRTLSFLGSEATEERAKEVAPGARILHFACHGFVDQQAPLDSALVLSLPDPLEKGRENGLLQAWEIAENLSLDADLVTLSACDSALGRNSGSEGLISLTRAFQIAGARSVLASLWRVSDLSTADLMKRFYGHLRAGKPKDEALQAAQVELIHSREFSHPYFWGAFQLSGDWR